MLASPVHYCALQCERVTGAVELIYVIWWVTMQVRGLASEVQGEALYVIPLLPRLPPVA